MSRDQDVSSTKLYSIRKLGSHDNKLHTVASRYCRIETKQRYRQSSTWTRRNTTVRTIIQQLSPFIEPASEKADSFKIKATKSISPESISTKMINFNISPKFTKLSLNCVPYPIIKKPIFSAQGEKLCINFDTHRNLLNESRIEVQQVLRTKKIQKHCPNLDEFLT